jgi:hypothetical protein
MHGPTVVIRQQEGEPKQSWANSRDPSAEKLAEAILLREALVGQASVSSTIGQKLRHPKERNMSSSWVATRNTITFNSVILVHGEQQS